MPPQLIGVITYNHRHLKTEQVLLRYVEKGFVLKLFALPFAERRQRVVRYPHRPDSTAAAHPKDVARLYGIPYIECGSDRDIDELCDLYVILGAGILSPECVRGKKIVNCHPGIIPLSRGLDSFKWAIHEMKPVGNTLHYVDAQVDAGQVVSVMPTPVFASDTYTSLARRHYENEIDMLSNLEMHLKCGQNTFADQAADQVRKRMPQDIELQMIRRFSEYVERMSIAES